jgi:hypothetical protein
MLNTLPVIVSPTTDRAGFDTHFVVKDTFDLVPGDGSYVGKYSIPLVNLKRCDEKLDFACLLAIGTTPFQVQSKQLDGLDKTANLRSIRFTGAATYSIQPGGVSRSSIELITNTTPDPLLNKTLSVFINGLASASEPEGNDRMRVLVNNLTSFSAVEGNGSIMNVTFDNSLITSQAETSISISVKIDNYLVSSSAET